MGENDGSGPLIKVDGSVAGVAEGGLEVSEALPGVLRNLFSPKWVTRRLVEHAIGQRIVDKISGGAVLDDAEAEFAEGVLGDAAAKFVRHQRILHRGATIFRQLSPSPQSPSDTSAASNDSSARSTSKDWVNKFRDDTGLVDDEMLQEIYARVLASEAVAPGAVSLRTLGVIRYLDRGAAEAFAKLQAVLIDGMAIPQQRPGSNALLERAGLSHRVLLALDDAGLVNSAAQSTISRVRKERLPLFRLRAHKRLIAFQRHDEAEFQLQGVGVHMLTTAGRELARVADVTPDPAILEPMIEWLYDAAGRPEEVLSANLPSSYWEGKLNDLVWHVWKDGRQARAPTTGDQGGTEGTDPKGVR